MSCDNPALVGLELHIDSAVLRDDANMCDLAHLGSEARKKRLWLIMRGDFLGLPNQSKQGKNDHDNRDTGEDRKIAAARILRDYGRISHDGASKRQSARASAAP